MLGLDRSVWIEVIGARANNLHDVNVRVRKNKITAFTGVSGSGKSSLVFDTIAAEAQRLVNETFPSFVQNRLPRYPQPDVDEIDGLMFTTVVDQRRFTGHGRSTVGTASDIASLLRVVFSRAGMPSAGYSPAYSFNDPAGMCPNCEGLGQVDDIDLDALFDRSLSLAEGAILFPTFRPGTYRWKRYVYAGVLDPAKRLADYSGAEWETLLYAEELQPSDPGPEFPKTARFEGVVPRMRRAYLRTKPARLTADEERALRRVVSRHDCPECHGTRLNPAARTSLIDGRSIADWSALPVSELREVAEAVRDPRVAPAIAATVTRLAALDEVGLGYLSLDRDSSTLSGGEAQRVKVVRHLGSALSGVCYVFDEPSTGLHPHDVHRLTELLTRLRDAGNTVLVVEHHLAVITAADHVVDLGPGAGSSGGTVQYAGTPAGLAGTATATGRMLGTPLRLRSQPRTERGTVTIAHAQVHNLADVSVDVPLGVLTVATGVAGSGKSSLFAYELPRQHPEFVVADQVPLRGGIRSTATTALGVADQIRERFAAASGLEPSWFSANARGACPVCKGKGVITTDLAFLDHVRTVCDACGGSRFNLTALAATIDGHSIADVLAMTASQAAEFFAAQPGIAQALAWLERTGLGYLAIGQSLDTLSGGERQRLQLARHLGEAPGATPRRLVLDEPTAGLHDADVVRLLILFDELIDAGATVIAIEHNQRVIAHADHVIDIGPGAGHNGGTVVYQGPPDGLVRHAASLTGRYLRKAMNGG